MALSSQTIETIKQIAEKLERWANNRKRHKMLCNALSGLGCRTSRRTRVVKIGKVKIGFDWVCFGGVGKRGLFS